MEHWVKAALVAISAEDNSPGGFERLKCAVTSWSLGKRGWCQRSLASVTQTQLFSGSRYCVNRERKGERCHSAGGILDFELVAHQAAGCHASS